MKLQRILCLEKILPNLIHPCQSGYVKGRFIGESIRLIEDTMHFTKEKNIRIIAAIWEQYTKSSRTNVKNDEHVLQKIECIEHVKRNERIL